MKIIAPLLLSLLTTGAAYRLGEMSGIEKTKKQAQELEEAFPTKEEFLSKMGIRWKEKYDVLKFHRDLEIALFTHKASKEAQIFVMGELIKATMKVVKRKDAPSLEEAQTMTLKEIEIQFPPKKLKDE